MPGGQDDAQRLLQRCRALSQQAMVQSKRFAGEWDGIREELDSIFDKLKTLKSQVRDSSGRGALAIYFTMAGTDCTESRCQHMHATSPPRS